MPSKSRGEDAAAAVLDAVAKLAELDAKRADAYVALIAATTALRSVVGDNVGVQVGKCVVMCRPGCNRPTVIQIGG